MYDPEQVAADLRDKVVVLTGCGKGQVPAALRRRNADSTDPVVQALQANPHDTVTVDIEDDRPRCSTGAMTSTGTSSPDTYQDTDTSVATMPMAPRATGTRLAGR